MADPGPVPAAERGTLDIRVRAIEHTIEAIVLELDTVRQDGGLSPLANGLPRVDLAISGRTARAKVDVAAVWPAPVSTLALQVRDAVLAKTGPLVGVDVRIADITVHVLDRADSGLPTPKRVQ